jgi:hypothetical protein
MKTLTCALLALLGCNFALANSNFVSNPRLPYPPACARVPAMDASAEPDAQVVKFYDEQIELYESQSGTAIPVGLTVYRSACSEPGRSLIWLQFTLAETDASPAVEFLLPTAVAEVVDHWRIAMNLASEPNSWGSGGRVDAERTFIVSQPRGSAAEYVSVSGERSWLFLLDGGPQNGWWYGDSGLTPSQYNARFKLVLRFPPYDFLSIAVPATAELFPMPAPSLPLSGRHSGTWVIESAADQGFQLAISEQVGRRTDFRPGVPELPLVIFFSQYTFNEDSEPLWLVGNAEFVPGADSVTVPILQVSNGEFRGSKTAQRQVIGSVTLTSNSCNDLTFQYDYSSIGLGTGSWRLQRLFSLETAGYDCRDYEARVEANTH